MLLSITFAYASDNAKYTAAYIPIDDRPGNLQRVQYAAQASGFELYVPDSSLIHTSLNNQPLNPNGRQYGDTDSLMRWIKETDSKTDNFIISLDQLLSGGLVHSRVGGLIKNETDVIDKVIELARKNNVYIFDTVIRLSACTVGYERGTVEVYDYMRDYFDRDAQTVYQTMTSKYVQEIVTAQVARQRKLEIIKYMLQHDNTGKIKYYIGVDDSSSRENIQSAEIEQIKGWLKGRGTIYSGTDEIGLMMFSDLAAKTYNKDVKAYVRYFGGNEDSGTEYDFDTVRENVESHIAGSGARVTDNINDADMQVLVMTLHDKNKTQSEYTHELLNEYSRSPIPAVIIDIAETEYDAEENMYHKDLVKMLPYMGTERLLAFSSWNGGGNAVGMAVGNAVSRMAYLKKYGESTPEIQRAYEKELIFSFAKDIGYKMMNDGAEQILTKYLRDRGYSTSNFYEQREEIEWAMNNGLFTECMARSVAGINKCISGIDENGFITYSQINSIYLSNYRAPWYRTFEINFDINVN